ncbi:MAG TPA: glycosyltransferase family 9 protein [Cytophagaceae bacterium]|jgi:heptosyltransferase-3|nr:glycosyltransferase family 9 protein [Cytophagaceae bacterium]
MRKKIIISRTDNLGDVILTLPLAGILKSEFKDCEIFFIGKSYTRSIIESSIFIDHFIDREEIIKNAGILNNIKADIIVHVYPDKRIARAAYKSNIPVRIGSSHRFYHWLYCNKKINFSRKNSSLHEAELNQKLLEPLGIIRRPATEIAGFYGMEKITRLNQNQSALLDKNKFNLILHPKSKGSAREWPLDNYLALINNLPAQKFQVFITGTEQEGKLMKEQKPEIFQIQNIWDLTGKYSLSELVSFINAADGLLACSTGPLHIASALGKFACGIYPPMKPIHPGRWAPIGKKARYLALNKDCQDCRKSEKCACIAAISVGEVSQIITDWEKERR